MLAAGAWTPTGCPTSSRRPCRPITGPQVSGEVGGHGGWPGTAPGAGCRHRHQHLASVLSCPPCSDLAPRQIRQPLAHMGGAVVRRCAALEPRAAQVGWAWGGSPGCITCALSFPSCCICCAGTCFAKFPGGDSSTHAFCKTVGGALRCTALLCAALRCTALHCRAGIPTDGYLEGNLTPSAADFAAAFPSHPVDWAAINSPQGAALPCAASPLLSWPTLGPRNALPIKCGLNCPA